VKFIKIAVIVINLCKQDCCFKDTCMLTNYWSVSKTANQDHKCQDQDSKFRSRAVERPTPCGIEDYSNSAKKTPNANRWMKKVWTVWTAEGRVDWDTMAILIAEAGPLESRLLVLQLADWHYHSLWLYLWTCIRQCIATLHVHYWHCLSEKNL